MSEKCGLWRHAVGEDACTQTYACKSVEDRHDPSDQGALCWYEL